MENIKSFFEGAWEYAKNGELSQVLITCNDDDYDTAIGVRRGIQAISDAVPVKIVAGDTLTLDEDTIINLGNGLVAISYIHDGHWFVRPSIETHTMTFVKETT